MRRRSFKRTAFIALLAIMAPISAFAAGQVGETAADFTLDTPAGTTHMLSSHQGEVVFLFMAGYG